MSPQQGSLIARIVVLGVVAVFVQIGVVSEVPVFGVNVEHLAAVGRIRGPHVRVDGGRRRSVLRSACWSTWRSCRRSA